MNIKKNSLLLFSIFLFLIVVFLYRDSFMNFFFQDDFFNMTLANKQSLVDAFNIFRRPEMNFYFYRPLTTQLFWSMGQKFFDFTPLGYHLIIFDFFLINLLLIYKINKLLKFDSKSNYLITFFYAVSATHFYRLFFLSQFQEIALATFVLLTLFLYLKGSRFFIVTFIFALMSKETAVVLPLILVSYHIIFGKKANRWFIASSFLLVILYILIRKFFFGFATSEIYAYNFSPKKIANNFFWYGVWSLGLPEQYLDLNLFKLPTIINFKIFTAFDRWGREILIVFFSLLFLLVKQVVSHKEKFIKNNKFIFGVAVFIIFLLPVAFFPFHKFAYSLTLPLWGISMCLGIITGTYGRRIGIVIVLLYFILSYFSIQFNTVYHWAIKRAKISENVITYFRENYPKGINNKNIYFRNNDQQFCPFAQDRLISSQMVSYAIGNLDGLKLFFKNQTFNVEYEYAKKDYYLLSWLVLDAQKFTKWDR